MEPVAQLARSFAPSSTVLFSGRHVGYPVALEGALKLKELAYMHAEGFAAGELKHGPIALIEDGLPVIVVMPSPKNSATLHAKLLSNIREIQARGASPSSSPRKATTPCGRTPITCSRSRRCQHCCSPCCRRFRCRCSRRRSPRPAATTSTNPATWPSPSPSNNRHRPRRPARQRRAPVEPRETRSLRQRGCLRPPPRRHRAGRLCRRSMLRFDLTTSLGTVRGYRFEGAGSALRGAGARPQCLHPDVPDESAATNAAAHRVQRRPAG